MQGKSSTGLNVGGSSILVIFVLLCLTTFATLSMVSANADYKLTAKTAEASVQYYEADAAAEQRLGEIDTILAQAWASSDDMAAYYSNINAALLLTDLTNSNDFFMMELLNMQDGAAASALPPFTIGYAVPINEQQELLVSLEVLYPSSSDAPRYQVATWIIVNTASLDAFGEDDEPLNLFTGEWS